MLALLCESDLVLPDDVVKMIVDKVKMSCQLLCHYSFPKLWFESNCCSVCRLLMKQMQRVMVRLMRRSGKHM